MAPPAQQHQSAKIPLHYSGMAVCAGIGFGLLWSGIFHFLTAPPAQRPHSGSICVTGSAVSKPFQVLRGRGQQPLGRDILSHCAGSCWCPLPKLLSTALALGQEGRKCRSAPTKATTPGFHLSTSTTPAQGGSAAPQCFQHGAGGQTRFDFALQS